MAFYYDKQLAMKDFTIKLYEYKKGSKGEYDESAPIATAIMTENFDISISNGWTNFDGGNMIENGWNKIKPFAGYADSVANIFSNMKDTGVFDQVQPTNKLSGFVRDVGVWFANNANKMNDYLNKSLVVQGTRFIYFQGTDISMGNLMMKFTVMHDPILGTVQDQLHHLMPYMIGKFVNMSEKGILSLVGWQDPPGGFKANWMNVDHTNEGTLKLVFGDNMYSIDNLVVKDANISLSKSRAKVPGSDVATPLYAEVAITLQPAGYITRRKLKEYMNMPGLFNDEV